MPDTEPDGTGEGDAGVFAGPGQHVAAEPRQERGAARRRRDGRVEVLASGRRGGRQGGVHRPGRPGRDRHEAAERRGRQVHLQRLSGEPGGTAIEPELPRPQDLPVRGQAPVIPLGAADQQDVKLIPKGRQENRPEEIKRRRRATAKVLGALQDHNGPRHRHGPQGDGQQPAGLCPVAAAGAPGRGLADPGRRRGVPPGHGAKQRQQQRSRVGVGGGQADPDHLRIAVPDQRRDVINDDRVMRRGERGQAGSARGPQSGPDGRRLPGTRNGVAPRQPPQAAWQHRDQPPT